MHRRRVVARAVVWSLTGWLGSYVGPARADELQFNRDIRPILAENCYACHGPDANHREADLRLDDPDLAAARGAIVPGDPDASELVRRVESDNPDERMPPAEFHKSLSRTQTAMLREWIRDGARFEKHWAYTPPERPAVAAGAHPIDALVEIRLTPLGLEASPEADRRILIRRLSFDLLGLPPTPREVNDFLTDSSPDAWEHLVDRLLKSPHFGERMAQGWLDVVRYADTIGYHSDNPQPVWPYRDYVIDSFNANKPFDQFTIEQLAGDLLPNPTREQLVGSCFNRLLLTTEEGGAQAKDYEARMLADRVRAVGAVWLGQTLGCSQCHDHKFDPITQRDFYSLGAFFADIDEPIIGRREAGMMLATPEEEANLSALRTAADALRLEYDAMSPELAAAAEAWERAVLANLDYRDRRRALRSERAGADAADQAEQGLATPPDEILAIMRLRSADRTSEQAAAVLAHFKEQLPELSDLRGRLHAADQARADFEAALPRCLVSKSLATPRTVRVLPRGNWMDETGPIVEPALPRYLTPDAPNSNGARLTRLDLARWIVARDNPLTARVFVNRLWKQYFGLGISKSLDDLGSQGEWPTHPELLDHLACEFMDSGWDVKHLVRHIVTSKTYRQASTASPELLARDPDNRLLARQSRFRLEAELVRDNALSISGLLVPTLGGPSVKPYQPEGYWEYLNFPERTYVADQGPAQHRRGIYTWWQRTFAHPSLLAFDAPSREECCAERPRSNIPQQALVLLNDPTYVEAARAFATRILCDGGAGDSAKIAWAWQQALSRAPREEEVEVVLALIAKHRAEIAEEPRSAEPLLGVGQAPLPDDIDRVELAAWTSVARLVLNLHETITRN